MGGCAPKAGGSIVSAGDLTIREVRVSVIRRSRNRRRDCLTRWVVKSCCVHPTTLKDKG